MVAKEVPVFETVYTVSVRGLGLTVMGGRSSERKTTGHVKNLDKAEGSILGTAVTSATFSAEKGGGKRVQSPENPHHGLTKSHNGRLPIPVDTCPKKKKCAYDEGGGV